MIMKIIGVTGGIGSGKSTVTRILADLGAKVIDADRIAREVVRKGQPALDELVGVFGPSILDENGELDRKKLAGIVFNDRIRLEELNRITHKHVTDKIVKAVDKFEREGNAETLVLDVPIPVKEGFRDLANEIWTVTADKETRIKRVMERSGASREEVLERINSQAREENYTGIADVVIENNGSIEDLEKSVVKLYVRSKS